MDVKVEKDQKLTQKNNELYREPASVEFIIDKIRTATGAIKEKCIKIKTFKQGEKVLAVKKEIVGMKKDGKIIFDRGAEWPTQV